MEDDLEIGARNFVLCRGVSFDATHPAAPYTLHNLLSSVRKGANASRTSRPIYTYVEYFGKPGEYEVWIDVVFLGYDEMMGEEEEYVAPYGPFDLDLKETVFIAGRAYPLRNLPLIRVGVYEFQLKIAGVYERLISQRLYVEE